MKKRSLLFVSVLFLVATPLLAQDKKSQTCSGTISEDGQSFVCEKDHKTWKVSNPGSLRDMEGQHAKLAYHLTSTAGEIFVTSASTIQGQQQTVARNPNSSTFLH